MDHAESAQRIAEILSRIGKLPCANLEPPQFFANFLQLSVAATGSAGGAIWVLQSDKQPQCYCHVEIERCNINDSSQQRVIVEAVLSSAQQGKTLVLPAGAAVAGSAIDSAQAPRNSCNHTIFFRPLRAADQVSMVLQLIAVETLTQEDYPTIAGLCEQVGETAETYLAHRRAVVLDDDRKSLARLLKYAESVHSSLDPERVAYEIANHGREAIGCNRLVVWIDPTVKRGLRAVSGVDKPDRRAVLLQGIEKLSQHCLEINKPIVASREQLVELTEEDKLTPLLKNYFNVSQLDHIFMQPIPAESKNIGVLVAEGFEESAGANLAGIVAAVANHGGQALANSLKMDAVPMLRPFGRIAKLKDDKKARNKWATIAAILVCAIALCFILQWTIRVEGRCEMRPVLRRAASSPIDTPQVTKVLRPSGPVQQGDVVMVLNDDDLQTQLYSLQAKVEQEGVKLQSAVRSADKKLYQWEIDRLTKEIEFFKDQIEKCKVRAPVSGMIMTAQLELMEGMPVSKGEMLFEVADLNRWELVVDIPQEEIGWLQRGLDKIDQDDQQDKKSIQGQKGLEAKKGLCVEFYLAAYPEHKLKAMVTDRGEIAQMARLKEDGNVFEIRIRVPQNQLAGVGQLRDQSLGRAKIDTVKRPLVYVLLRKVIRFFRVVFF